MSAPDDLRIVPLGPDDGAEVLRLDQAAFAFPLAEVDPEVDLLGFEWDRTFAAVRRAAGPHQHAPGRAWSAEEELAGLMTAYSLDLTVPGAGGATRSVPMAGLSWVSVHPDHRRRGILTELIRHHLDGLHGRPDSQAQHSEPVSGLFASEPAIYQRFGYGAAASGLALSVPTGAALRPMPGGEQVQTQLTGTSVPGVVELAVDLANRAALRRPGGVRRPAVALASLLRDRPERHPGVEHLKLVVARRAGEPTGFAVFRRQMDWSAMGPSGTAKVLELVGLDAATEHALWTRVLSLDLIRTVTTPVLAPDHPLLTWLVDIRAAQATWTDALWLRLVDVGRALTARGYAADVDAVVEVTDAMCPWNAGRWRLAARDGEATYSATDDAPDLTLDVRDLATAYLGGPALAALADAGLVVEHRAGAVAALSSALRGPTEPAVPQSF